MAVEARNLYEQAHQLYTDGAWCDAEPLADTAAVMLEVLPGDEAAVERAKCLILLGRCATEDNDFEHCIEMCTLALSLTGSALVTDRALYVRGRALLRAGRHEMAKCDLLQVVASSRLEQHGVDRQRAEELLVDARRSRGGLAGALAQPPLDVGRELLAAAADEFRQCKYVLCAEVCSQCEVVVADWMDNADCLRLHSECVMLRARCKMELGGYASCVQLCTQVLAAAAEGKQRERARYFRGRARLLEGSFEAAAEDLETVVRSGLVGDTEVDPPRRVAQLLLQAQDGARAKRRRLS